MTGGPSAPPRSPASGASAAPGWHGAVAHDDLPPGESRVGRVPEQGLLEHVRQNLRATVIAVSPLSLFAFAFLGPWVALAVVVGTGVVCLVLAILDAATLRRRGYQVTAWWFWPGEVLYLAHRARRTGQPPHLVIVWVVCAVLAGLFAYFYGTWLDLRTDEEMSISEQIEHSYAQRGLEVDVDCPIPLVFDHEGVDACEVSDGDTTWTVEVRLGEDYEWELVDRP